MTFNRCMKQQVFGNNRCQGTPDWAINEDRKIPITGEIDKLRTIHVQEGCKLDPESCGKLITLQEAVDLTAPWLTNPTYTETVLTSEGEKKEKGKPKTKAAKKLEQEMKQQTMFGNENEQ